MSLKKKKKTNLLHIHRNIRYLHWYIQLHFDKGSTRIRQYLKVIVFIFCYFLIVFVKIASYSLRLVAWFIKNSYLYVVSSKRLENSSGISINLWSTNGNIRTHFMLYSVSANWLNQTLTNRHSCANQVQSLQQTKNLLTTNKHNLTMQTTHYRSNGNTPIQIIKVKKVT